VTNADGDEMIYDTACVEVPLSRTTTVWRYAHISKGATIGERCTVGEGVHIGPLVVVGNGCKLQNGAQLFEGVTLEDDVFIGPHAVFTNIEFPRAHVSRRTQFRTTRVCKGASIGANATIICGLTIGSYALIGAGSVVTHDVKPHEVVVGNPARHHGWCCTCGELLFRDRDCTVCGARFRFTVAGIERLSTSATP